MAEHVMDARSRAAAGCALPEAKSYSRALLPAPQHPGKGRPGGTLLATIEGQRSKDGRQ